VCLVPNDNNIGQRNVSIVPGGGTENGLMKGLHNHIFFAGNSFFRKAKLALKVELPRILTAVGWKLNFEEIDGNKF
jgi:zinc metalloprotease ZmpB